MSFQYTPLTPIDLDGDFLTMLSNARIVALPDGTYGLLDGFIVTRMEFTVTGIYLHMVDVNVPDLNPRMIHFPMDLSACAKLGGHKKWPNRQQILADGLRPTLIATGE